MIRRVANEPFQASHWVVQNGSAQFVKVTWELLMRGNECWLVWYPLLYQRIAEWSQKTGVSSTFQMAIIATAVRIKLMWRKSITNQRWYHA